MTIVSRTTAKSYFETGDKPTQAQFIDTLDSTLFQEDVSTFGKAFISAATTASAQNLLGIPGINPPGTVGNILLAATTTASGQNNLGAGTVGKNVFEAITTASAQNNMGGGTVGKLIFEAITTASAANIISVAGEIVQEVFQTAAAGTGSTVMPIDNTVPQNNEGDEYITATITPKNSNNILEITFDAFVITSGILSVGVALFQDSTANSLKATLITPTNTGFASTARLVHTMTAGTTSATTFKIRLGVESVGILYVNRGAAGAVFGGVSLINMSIKEYKV